MMLPLNITVATIDVAVGDWPKTLTLIFKAIDHAIESGATFVAFPELTLGTMDAKDYLREMSNKMICGHLRTIAEYASSKTPDFSIFIGHPWQGPSEDTSPESREIGLSNRDKYWNAYSHLAKGDIQAMALKQQLDEYTSRLEERDYVGGPSNIDITLPETVTQPSKIINAGDVTFQLSKNNHIISVYPVMGDQALLDPAFVKKLQKKNALILNPTATPSHSNLRERHETLKKIARDYSIALVHINSVGGMNGGQGNLLVINQNQVIAERLSAPLCELSCLSIHLTQPSLDLATSETPQESTIKSQIRWVFNYLTHTGLPKVHLILPVTGDISSTYSLYLVRKMIEEYLKSHELDALLKKLGYFDQKEAICSEVDTLKAIMNRVLTCIYFQGNPDNVSSAENIRILVESVGAKYLVRDVRLFEKGMEEVLGHSFKEPKALDRIHELGAAIVSLGVGNIENGICISALSIDQLIKNPRFGARLHSGQINFCGAFFTSELAELLKTLLSETAPSATCEDQQFHCVARYALYEKTRDEKRKLSPIEVYEACKKEDVFSGMSSQELHAFIQNFYTLWSKAQYAIHASPVTFNHDQKAIEHNMGLRTPIINGFHRDELAQLALHIHRKNDLSEGLLGKTENSTMPLIERLDLKKPIPVKIAQASLNQTGRNINDNLVNIFAAIDHAVKDQANILALPELALSGYDCGDTFQYSDNQQTASLLQKIADYAANKNPNLLISMGHPWKLEGAQNPASNPNRKPFNVQSLLGRREDGSSGVLMMKYKGDLYGEGRGFERRYFAYRLDQEAPIQIQLPNTDYTVPFSRKLVARIGNSTQGYFDLTQVLCEEYWKRSCYDGASNEALEYPRHNIIGQIKNDGYEIGLCITAHASPPSPGKLLMHEHLTTLASQHIQEHGVVVHVDTAGSSGASYVNAGTRYAAQDGKMLVDGAGVYSFKDLSYTSRVYDIPRAAGKTPHVQCTHHFLSSFEKTSENIIPDTWRQLENSTVEIELNIRNQVLALYHIMRKSGVRSFTQALSGGADSAWNITKVRLMIELGTQELGVEIFLRSLNYSEKTINKILAIESIKAQQDAIMKRMTVCYYLATPNNSKNTENAARQLIKGDGINSGIGGTFIKFNIQSLVNRFSAVLLGLKTWPTDPILETDLLTKLQTCLLLPPSTESQEKYREIAAQIKTNFGEIDGVILSPSQRHYGIAVENGQARVRQMITSFLTSMLSQHPELLGDLMPPELSEDQAAGACFGLSNPNENEARRAYTTFGGDLHSGEINPNGQLPKDEQLTQMAYVCEKGLQGLAPVSGLAGILRQTPSAELQPKSEDGTVVQFDEKAFGLSFKEATRLNHLRAQKVNPFQVLKACQQEALFAGQSMETLRNKILLTYQGFIPALHKLTAAPLIQTYGEYTIDSKSSMQAPMISVHERYELEQFMLDSPGD